MHGAGRGVKTFKRLQRLGGEQIPDKVRRNKGFMGEAAERDEGSVGEGVVDEMNADNTAKQ